MRPTKLTMSAFGSYADRVEIDFNELGEHGLYIVTGNTGVGKTKKLEVRKSVRKTGKHSKRRSVCR